MTSKYKNKMGMKPQVWGNIMETAIANELAEANRLKRLELDYKYKNLHEMDGVD